VLEALHGLGVRYIAIRAAGYDNVGMERAGQLGMKVANVPAYSPNAIAEHAVALMLALNRKLILADRQVHAYNFTVGGLMGFDMHGKTVGIIGTGKIGRVTARILHGFGCRLLGHDIKENASMKEDCQLRYVGLEELYASSDIITLHTPLNPQTAGLINSGSIAKMKPGVMLINTSRGGLVKTTEVIDALARGHISAFGADVYEAERGLFFFDHSAAGLKDPVLKKLLDMPNVLVTPHQAFATHEAMTNIADTSFSNIDCWAHGEASPNEL
jgi:D-lactate dehydrogenase